MTLILKSDNSMRSIKIKPHLLSLLLTISLVFLVASATRGKTAAASTTGGSAQDTIPPGVTVPATEMVITAVYTSFHPNNIQAFQLNGASALAGDALQLNPVTPSASGSAWWSRPIYLGANRSFSAHFQIVFQRLAGDDGADGLVFAVQSMSTDALGGGGGGFGFQNIFPSAGVEFDTFFNEPSGDPDDNHVGLDMDGWPVSLKTATPSGLLEDGLWYVWVEYDGVTDNLQLRMSRDSARPDTALLDVTDVDLTANLDTAVYMGFTAATGNTTESHSVRSFYFHNDYLPKGITPDTISYVQGPFQISVTGPLSLTDNGIPGEISALASDLNGTPMAGQTITFSTDLGQIDPISVVTGPDGTATVNLSSTSLGQATVRAIAEGGAFGEAGVDIISGTNTYLPLVVR